MSLHELTITEASALLRSGRLGALEYAEALLARAQTLSSLNAFIHLDPAAIRQAARAADAARARGEGDGLLHGVPITLKDNLDTAGIPTTGGTPGLAGHVPKRNAPVVERLLQAGALVFGKANLHELAFGITTNNAAFGATRNPWDTDRIAGGSSGGTAAAVAARLVPGGIGTDTGGSIRVPAALCGVVGFRPTIGTWPQQGVVPISQTRDTAGPIARSVQDCALLHGVVTGAPTHLDPAVLKGLRLGVPRAHFWQDLDPQVALAGEQALTRLREAGVELIEADLPQVAQLDQQAGFPIALYEAVRDLGAYLRTHEIEMDFAQLAQRCASPDVHGLLTSLAAGGAVPRGVWIEAVQVARPALQQRYRDYFAEHRVQALVFPTTVLPAARIGEDETVMLRGQAVPTFATFIRNCGPASVAGIPGLSLPMGLTESGLPMGLELDAPHGHDLDLLAVADAVSRALPQAPVAPL
jgi:indoleacetamide hydrolase